MLKKVMMFIGAFVIATSALANPVVEQTIYAVTAKEPDRLEAYLRTVSAEEDGQPMPVVEGDEVYLARLATSLHGWAITKGYLAEEAVKNHRLFQQALTERYGEKRNVKELIGLAAQGKFLIPAKVASAAQPKQPAVAAASAPTPAPVAVAQAPAPVAKTEPEVLTRKEFLAALKQQEQANVASLDSQAKIMAGIIRRQAEVEKTAKDRETFYKKALAQISDPAEREATKKALASLEAAKQQVAEIGAAQKVLKGDVTGLTTGVATIGQKQFWQNVAIVGVGLLALLGLAAIWWRIKKVQAKVAVDIGVAKTDAIMVAKGYTDQVNSTTTKKMAGLRADVDKLDERVEVAEGILYKDPEWRLSEEQRKQLFGAVFALQDGGETECGLELASGVVVLSFKDEGEDFISIVGTDVRPFHKKKVCVVVTRLYHEGKLPVSAAVPIKLAA